MESLLELGRPLADRLVTRGETVSVTESSGGGLIASSLLSVPGASRYFIGGGVIYTKAARDALLPAPGDALKGVRSASEPYAVWLARTVKDHLGTDWGLAETGAAGPSGNRYGDPAGHTCIAVAGPVDRVITLKTGADDREANMWSFTKAALALLADAIDSSRTTA